jgi:glycosyltransferase involved in cell wall biosynthesis
MSESKKISVIIPVFNPGKYLTKCLESIVNQTYKNIEIILVDDGSTDGSGDVCDEYAEKDNRVIVIHQKNSGVSKARNAGIRAATGYYYYFPDSDDYIETDCFEYCVNLLNKYKCDIVSFEYFVTYADKEIKHSREDSLYGLFDIEGSYNVLMSNVTFACTRMYKKSAVNGIYFKEDIVRGEDSVFVYECFKQINSAYFDKRAMYHYVQSEESAVRGKFRPSQLSILKLYDEYKRIFEKDYPGIYLKSIINLLSAYVSIYYDMYADESNLKQEMKKVHNAFVNQYNEIKEHNLLSIRGKTKFTLFRYSPGMFCFIHKIIHRL